MEFSLDARTAKLGVGELADFQIGPRDSGDGPQGLWRAQLGTRWHQELRTQVGQQHPTAVFEVAITGTVFHRGWTVSLAGRVDQLILPAVGALGTDDAHATLREIKTVLRAIPAAEEELRAEYPSYFAQLATYLALSRLTPLHPGLPRECPLVTELMFVEAGSGLAQSVRLSVADESSFWVQLERLTEFLDLRLRARDRLRALQFRPAFEQLRPGQETIQQDLQTALGSRAVVLFEAPTGFGKTGALLEAALRRMREGQVERVLYLTSKSTGQLQVAAQLRGMTAPEEPVEGPDARARGLAVWQVRNKREHCVNHAFHCVREACQFLHDVPARWNRAALSRFYLHPTEDRSMEAVRAAGQSAGVCPYEITRTALGFHDVWIGDYNYVFSPSNRGLFYDQPGFEPKRTLLVVDEAHNLPNRVADVYSRHFSLAEAVIVGRALAGTRAFAPLLTAWGHWTDFLQHLAATEQLPAAAEDDARDLLETVSKHVASVGLDFVELGPEVTEQLWGLQGFLSELALELPRLWWAPRPGELHVTCLDAASVIGPTLRSFGTAVLASATLTPLDDFTAACGLERTETVVESAEAPARLGKLNKRQTRKLFAQLSTGADLLVSEARREADEPVLIRAHTPWRSGAYDVACDLRVDTTYQQRARHHGTTAATVERLCEAARAQAGTAGTASACVAVFFPSYSYAEAIEQQLARSGSPLRVSIQPRQLDLASQRRWVEECLVLSDTLFLALGSSFAEGVDMLGGRIGWAMVVGPALPEVNAVQRARLGALSGLGREAAFRRVYQIPGIQKVNQALGRLVRAPGHRARVLLHCRRFVEPAYAALLAPEYQFGAHIVTDADFTDWLNTPRTGNR